MQEEKGGLRVAPFLSRRGGSLEAVAEGGGQGGTGDGGDRDACRGAGVG